LHEQPRLAFGRAKVGFPSPDWRGSHLEGQALKEALMFDDLLQDKIQEKERELSNLYIWAKNDWLKHLKELPPYSIADLCFFHVEGKIEQDKRDVYGHEHKKKIDAMIMKRRAFQSLIEEEAKSGKLPSRTVDFYKCKWPFNTERYGFEYNHLLPDSKPERWAESLPTLLITSKDFREWLRSKGKWPLEDGCLINAWFTDDKFYDYLEIEEYDPSKPTNEYPESAIEDTIPTSLYRLVLGMAMDAYHFDPTEKKQENGTMQNISASLERQGLGSMKRDTILKQLREAVKRTGWKPR
jgi:hypothetical protein